MPTVYSVTLINHVVDAYETAQKKVIGARCWAKSCGDVEREAWAEHEAAMAPGPKHPSAGTTLRRQATSRRMMDAVRRRHDAESELAVAIEHERQAMRALCDSVLLERDRGRERAEAARAADPIHPTAVEQG